MKPATLLLILGVTSLYGCAEDLPADGWSPTPTGDSQPTTTGETAGGQTQPSVGSTGMTVETTGTVVDSTGGMVVPTTTGGQVSTTTGGDPVTTTGGDPGTTTGEPAGTTTGMSMADGGVEPMGDGSVTTPEDAGPVEPEQVPPPCIAKGDEVLSIGDSYSDYYVHDPIAQLLSEQARADGDLGARDSYRNKAVAGTTLASGTAPIPKQWENNKSTPTKIVVMSAGGNDVLIDNPGCRAEGSESKPECQKVVQASLDKGAEMFASMKAAGVSDVFWFWYPHIPGGLLTGFEKGTSIADYTYPMLVDAAASATTESFRVHMVPTVDLFEGHPEYFASDGLHANTEGSTRIAERIWGLMDEGCIGQAESSGCCMP